MSASIKIASRAVAQKPDVREDDASCHLAEEEKQNERPEHDLEEVDHENEDVTDKNNDNDEEDRNDHKMNGIHHRANNDDGDGEETERHPLDDQDTSWHLYNPLEAQRFKARPKVWPPAEGPNDDRCYVVEGMGGQGKSREDDDDNRDDAGFPRAEIVEDHVEPVSTLKKRFSGKPPVRAPGVNKPPLHVKEPVSWIKHEKLPPQYDNNPKELPWMQLVRNRRWNSTVKARFPCQKEDVTKFERRSTTPKNWNSLLRDKHTAKMLSEITGMEGAGEELLYRLTEKRQHETLLAEEEADPPMTEEEILAYQYVRDNLQDAVLKAGGDHRRRTGSESDAIKEEMDYTFTRLLKTPLRLHPEQFKKLLSLERSREATLRWQFSSDPYDSVHEHQYLPFEVALATADNDRLIHQALKKLLQSYDYDHVEIFGSPPETPPEEHRRMSESSGAEGRRRLESLSSQEGGEGRSRSMFPMVKPRRSRSVSPSVRCATEMDGEEVERAPEPQEASVEEKVLKEQLCKLQKEIGLKSQIPDVEAPVKSDGIPKTQKGGGETSSSEEEHNLNVEQRMKKFLDGVKKADGLVKKSSIDRDEIDTSEIASRRNQFLNKEKQTSLDSEDGGRRNKPRRKLQRRRSDADLHDWLTKRRQKEDAEDEEQQQQQQQQQLKQGGNRDMLSEMTNLINDIQETFSNEK